MSDALVPVTNQVSIRESLETTDGSYIKKSRICPICMRLDHMEINMMRARSHMPVHSISQQKGVSPDALTLHFKNHFIISKNNQDIIDIQENSSQESNEIITRILDGDIDFFGGAQSVLKSKAQRLLPIQNRLKALSDQHEIDNMEDVDKQEYILLNKLAEDVENSIMKVHQIIDKKMFPSSKEEIVRAVMSYKLSILNKFVDDIILVLMEFEKQAEYRDLIQQIRLSLSQRVSNLESLIIKSGGEMRAIEPDENEIQIETNPVDSTPEEN